MKSHFQSLVVVLALFVFGQSAFGHEVLMGTNQSKTLEVFTDRPPRSGYELENWTAPVFLRDNQTGSTMLLREDGVFHRYASLESSSATFDVHFLGEHEDQVFYFANIGMEFFGGTLRFLM